MGAWGIINSSSMLLNLLTYPIVFSQLDTSSTFYILYQAIDKKTSADILDVHLQVA